MMVDFSRAAAREDLEAARVRRAARVKDGVAVGRGRVDPSPVQEELVGEESVEDEPKAAAAEPERHREVDEEASARARSDRVRRMYAEINSRATTGGKNSDNRAFTGPN